MANFSARPHIEDRQMVQWMGESINLSGQTNFDLGGFNGYIYESYRDFLNGVSGTTFLSLPFSAATDPISGWSNQTLYQPGILKITPPHKVFFSGNTNIISATTQQDVTNYIATSFDSTGTVVWTPLSGLTSMSGSCTPDFYVGTIHPCGSGGTVTIEGNLLVRGETISATTIIETETILVEDNNIEMNWGGDHTSALGGGITVLSGVSNTPAAFGFTDSTISTDGIGTWVLNTGLDVGNQTYSVPHKSMGVGENNLVGASHSGIIGRDHELNKGPYSTILGGRSNYMRQPSNSVDDGGYATIMGGSGHTLEYIPSSAPFTATQWSIPVSNSLGFGNGIFGGAQNRMYDSTLSSILGGYNNFMETSLGGSILGGVNNTLFESSLSTVIGGSGNTITSDPSNTFGPNYSGIFAGLNNTITASGQLGNNNFFSGSKSVILGGGNNLISGHTFASILGGYNNEIYSSAGYNSIIAGEFNKLGSGYSVILGGQQNTLGGAGDNSFILGGQFNTILQTGTPFGVLAPSGLDNGGIIGGRNNTVTGGTITSDNKGGTILGGLNNKLLNTLASNDMWYSGIILGADNTITSTQNTGGIGSSTANDGNLASLIIGGQENSLTDSDRSIILGGYQNLLSNTKNSIILGGSGLTGNTDNTVFVPGLNINIVPTGETISLLAITSGGTVVNGASMYSSICDTCTGNFPSSGMTIDSGTTEVTVVGAEQPISVECTGVKCCSKWLAKYKDIYGNLTEEETTDPNVQRKLKRLYSAYLSCVDSYNTGINEGGTSWGTLLPAEPIHDTKPITTGVIYEDLKPTSSVETYIRGGGKVYVKDSSDTSISNSWLIAVNETTMSDITTTVNTVVTSGSQVTIESSTDGYIKRSNRVLMASSHNSEIIDATTSSIISSQGSTISGGTTGTTIMSAKDVVGTDSYTVYMDNAIITDDVTATTFYGDGSNLTGIAFTGNTSGNCITDLHVSNIHSCSPLYINPLDEGNIYFGTFSEDGAPSNTFDLTNNRLGIGIAATGSRTTEPQEALELGEEEWLGFNTKTSGNSQAGIHFKEGVGTGFNGYGVDMYYNATSGADRLIIEGVFNSVAQGGITVQRDGLVTIGMDTTGSTTTSTLQIGETTNVATLKYVDGNQTAGYVMTSDANGGVTWQAPSGGGSGTVTGTGTADYLSKWSSVSGQSNSLIRDDATSVGLGVAPSANDILSISTSTLTNGVNIVNSTVTTSTSTGLLVNNYGVGATGTKVGIQGIGNTVDEDEISIGGVFTSCGAGYFTNPSHQYGIIVAVDGNQGYVHDSIGVDVVADDAHSGDTYGLRIKAANAGVGNHYGVQIQDGTQSNGYVLTCDALGNGSWQASAGGGGDYLPTTGGTISGDLVVSGTTNVNGNETIRKKEFQTLTDAATVSWDMSSGMNAEVTLNGSRTLDITNVQDGDYGTLVVIQGVAGSHTLTLDGTYANRVSNGGGGGVLLTSTAGSHDIITWVYNGGTHTMYWNVGNDYS